MLSGTIIAAGSGKSRKLGLKGENSI